MVDDSCQALTRRHSGVSTHTHSLQAGMAVEGLCFILGSRGLRSPRGEIRTLESNLGSRL